MQILIIQTAFIGDVVLATPVIEKLSGHFPTAKIDFLLRKGNEPLLQEHPKLRTLLIWDKARNKYPDLYRIIGEVRKTKYDLVVNLQRFFSTGLVTVLSGADHTAGFRPNPLSFLFSYRKPHVIRHGVHEVERNLSLIAEITDDEFQAPKLYPSPENEQRTAVYKSGPYLTISPGSVWPTKRLPVDKWIAFLGQVPFDGNIYLLGGGQDAAVCEEIRQATAKRMVTNLAGQLELLDSAVLMRDARMNYTTDSAPLHLASAMNAPVRAVFCSTIPGFGFGPLSEDANVVQIEEELPCRPCGLHGRAGCPLGHFRCAEGIDAKRLLDAL